MKRELGETLFGETLFDLKLGETGLGDLLPHFPKPLSLCLLWTTNNLYSTFQTYIREKIKMLRNYINKCIMYHVGLGLGMENSQILCTKTFGRFHDNMNDNIWKLYFAEVWKKSKSL